MQYQIVIKPQWPNSHCCYVIPQYAFLWAAMAGEPGSCWVLPGLVVSVGHHRVHSATWGHPQPAGNHSRADWPSKNTGAWQQPEKEQENEHRNMFRHVSCWFLFLSALGLRIPSLISILPLCQCSACIGGTRVHPSEAGNAASSGSSPDTEDGNPSPGRHYRAGHAKRRPWISTAFWCPLCWLEGSGEDKTKFEIKWRKCSFQ